jgi:hypothetical protein
MTFILSNGFPKWRPVMDHAYYKPEGSDGGRGPSGWPCYLSDIEDQEKWRAGLACQRSFGVL